MKLKRLKTLLVYSVLLALTLQAYPAGIVFAGTYDPDLKASPHVLNVTGYTPSIVIDDFNEPDAVNQPGKWTSGAGAEKVTYADRYANGPNSPYEGSHVLEVWSDEVKAYEWRTVSRAFDQSLDLSDVNYLTFAANCYGWQTEDYLIKVTLFSGEDSYESIAQINPNSWSKVAVSVKDWALRDHVTKIEFAFMLNFDHGGLKPGDPGYEFWGGNYQIDYLSGSNAIGMDFNVDGETEGFTAQGAEVDAAGGELRLALTSAVPVLQSPVIIQDIDHYNTLSVKWRNESPFNKVKVEWITEESPDWDDTKSEVFDIEANNSQSVEQEFNLSLHPEWGGSLKQFRLTFLSDGGASTGEVGIDQIRFKQLAPIEVFPGELTRHEIAPSRDRIVIEGALKPGEAGLYEGGELQLFELQPYESERDLANREAIAEQGIQEQFRFELDLAGEEGRTRLQSKFAVAAMLPDGSLELVDRAKYVSNPEILAPNTYPFPVAKSKKGLQVQMVGDAEDLGISHAALNVDYNNALYMNGAVNPANTFEYSYEGETFYFKKDWIEERDNSIKSLSDNGVTVSLILLMYKGGMDDTTPNRYLLHPDATEGIVYAFNTTDELGTKYYKAITAFLAERYSREDEKYGRAVNYIVGNEVDAGETWYNMGNDKTVREFVQDYARTVRITNTVVKSFYSNARVYISLTHNWDQQLPSTQIGSFDGRSIIDTLQSEIAAEGDIPWHIAYHPYPENLFDPRAWVAPQSLEQFDTPKITFKNLHVLVDYMKQPKFMYGDEARRIILSEQGFHSGDNSPEGQQLQAAAYAYAYYITDFLDGIDSFILHRHVDHAEEYGLNLGLWTHDPDTSRGASIPAEHKLVYDVFKYIDTERSLEVTEFAKPIIGIADWQDIAPSFDAGMLARREIPDTAPAAVLPPEQLEGAEMLFDFENGDEGWTHAEYVSGVETDASLAWTGNQTLKATVMTREQLGDSKGIAKRFDEPLNAEGKPYLFFGINPSNGPAAESYTVRVKVYSDQHVLEAEGNVPPKQWSNLAVDLGDWAYKDRITKIKIGLVPASRVHWQGGYFHVDGIGLADGMEAAELTAALTPEQPDGNDGWYRSPVTVKLGAANGLPDGYGIQFRVNDGEWQTYGSEMIMDTDGIHGLDYRTMSPAGEPGSIKSLTLKIDQTAPVATVTADPVKLWPPNQRLVQVTASVDASDSGSDIGSVVLSSITSNEELQAEDIQGAELGTMDTSFSLRAARSGAGSGRIYTITYTVTDQAGNETAAVTQVNVPHDQSNP
ncbi:MAG: DUF5722 domain-containing protein [Paenibacillus lautus]|jgi:hypothetical protein|uniref:DUF5722 domain-containing protein n=1 Tax=Paenibacillus lautus TaxID=1401 RepID=UPI0026F00A99|nr:DUF5722 domain-containing protein [Paenibacillus lautus]MCI1773886.1 DUF5722 domain-containing protein [Paenibacillus lautus]